VEAPAREPTPSELRPEPGSQAGVPAGPLSGAAFEAVGIESDAWKAQSAVIRRFADAVLEMQVEPMVQAASAIGLHRDEMVPLAALQSPYCVIAQTPSFGVVEKALERLEDADHRGTRHASYAEDAFNVGRFHEIVTRSAGTIGAAIACAEVISRAAGVSGSHARYARGLATISQACQFESLADAEVRVALENVVQQIASDLEVQMAIDLPSAGASGVADIDSLVEYVRGLSTKTVKPYAASTLADEAWAALFVRLRRWVESGHPGAPDLIEIVAGTARRGPTGFIAFDPRKMAAADWTAVLAACRTARVHIARPSDAVPAWLGMFALRALGFRVIPADVPEVLDWLGMTSNLTPHEQSLRDDATSGRLFAQNDGMETNVVVIRRAVSALFARMRPSTDASEPKAAMLVATAEQLKALLAEGFPSGPLPGPPWLRNAQRNVLAVEMPPEREKDREQIEAELRRALADVQVVYVYDEDRPGMMLPNVVRPRGAEALIKAVR
jgi:hypothetical protein